VANAVANAVANKLANEVENCLRQPASTRLNDATIQV
jgi:hypothetical protein